MISRCVIRKPWRACYDDDAASQRWPAFVVAPRACLPNSRDHIINGRIAFNAITSHAEVDAENYGSDELMEHASASIGWRRSSMSATRYWVASMPARSCGTVFRSSWGRQPVRERAFPMGCSNSTPILAIPCADA